MTDALLTNPAEVFWLLVGIGIMFGLIFHGFSLVNVNTNHYHGCDCDDEDLEDKN